MVKFYLSCLLEGWKHRIIVSKIFLGATCHSCLESLSLSHDLRARSVWNLDLWDMSRPFGVSIQTVRAFFFCL